MNSMSQHASGEFDNNSGVSYFSGQVIHATGPCLFWMVQASAQPAALQIKPGHADAEKFYFNQDYPVIFYAINCSIVVLSGTVFVRDLHFRKFSKLQAFIDAASMLKTQKSHAEVCYGIKQLDDKATFNSRTFEGWYLYQNTYHPESINCIANLFRYHESYRLVNYLLNQQDSHKTLIELGNKYGLSTAHFRRLSRAALGQAVKVEMSNWRMIRAVLDMIDSETNITMVAFNHGYSSLSHFSSAVKHTFNKPPKELIKIIKNGS